MSKKQHEILSFMIAQIEAAWPGTKVILPVRYTGGQKQCLDFVVPVLGRLVPGSVTFPLTPGNARDPVYKMRARHKVLEIVNRSPR